MSRHYRDVAFFHDTVNIVLSKSYLEEILYAAKQIERLARGDLFVFDEWFLDQRFLVNSASTRADDTHSKKQTKPLKSGESTRANDIDTPVAYAHWEFSETRTLLMRWRDECLHDPELTPTDRLQHLQSAIQVLENALVSPQKPQNVYLDNWNVRSNSPCFVFQKNIEGDYSWSESVKTPLKFRERTQQEIVNAIPPLNIKDGCEIALTIPQAYAIQTALECSFRFFIGQFNHLEYVQHFTNIHWTWGYEDYDRFTKLFESEILRGQRLAGYLSTAAHTMTRIHDYLRYVLSYNVQHKSSFGVGHDEPDWDIVYNNMRCQAGTIEDVLNALQPNQGLGIIKSNNIYGKNTASVFDLHSDPFVKTTSYGMSKSFYELRLANLPSPPENIQSPSMSNGS